MKPPYINPGKIEDEYIPIQDMILPAEVYSKLFTHVVSLLFKADLPVIWNSQVSVSVSNAEGVRTDSYHIPKGFNANKMANASFVDKNPNYPDLNLVVGYIRTGGAEKNNQELYSTIWNILNLLGAHELVGHGVLTWWGDHLSSHHLTYLYQIGHPTFHNTTQSVKNKMLKCYKDYIDQFHPINWDKMQTGENTKILRDNGFYPEDGKIDIFTRKMIQEVQDTSLMKRSRPPGMKDTYQDYF